MTEEFKLYVWREVLRDYTAGIAVAAATSPAEAREVVLRDGEDWEKQSLAGDLVAEPEVYDLPAGAFCWGGG